MHAPEPPVAWDGALREVAKVHGDNVAIAMVKAYGGTTVYIPAHRIPDEHPLVLHLGREVVETLHLFHAGELVYIPISRAQRCRILHRHGLTIPAIARRLGIAQRSVRRLLRHLSPEQSR